MKQAEIIIDKGLCQGCGYCVRFCNQNCLQFSKDKYNSRGFAIVEAVAPEKCKGCGICVQMCPHWAIQVSVTSDDSKSVITGPPHLAQQPPMIGCAGCQHPTVGRILAEVIYELKYAGRAQVLEGLPCSISSALGMDFGTKAAPDEKVLDMAAAARLDYPSDIVVAIAGYWGQSDFSFDFGGFIKTLMRGQNLTIILCNTSFYGPRDQRPAPDDEPVEGQLEPITLIDAPTGRRLFRGGHPVHLAELAASFQGVCYSARGVLTSPKEYQVTKDYIRKACRKQADGKGLSFVEVLCTCNDGVYASPLDCLRWIDEQMTAHFPPIVFKDN
ncbi:MAG: 4Fe-4S dicluster domain-containing protein [Dehalococcoidales bacterium]|nr:4Fe-4S dicluster domain-containing protein [Dehalococcoidales bacterium]